MDEMDNVIRSLEQEYRLILLLNHRNKNQHRAASWYGSFNEMKRNCGQIITLFSSRRLQAKRLKDVEWVKLHRLLQRALFRQLKRWYWQFNGVIALGQFVTLGCTLVTLLANVRALYMRLWEINETEFIRCGCLIKNLPRTKVKSVVNDVEELGEIIDEDIGNNVQENELVITSIPKPLTENCKKKKKRKRRTNQPLMAYSDKYTSK
ncbi:Rmp1p [Saccharomyces cerevisiae R008]|nr:Rmp1p [Saccharomyces cerevisiae R008]